MKVYRSNDCIWKAYPITLSITPQPPSSVSLLQTPFFRCDVEYSCYNHCCRRHRRCSRFTFHCCPLLSSLLSSFYSLLNIRHLICSHFWYYCYSSFCSYVPCDYPSDLRQNGKEMYIQANSKNNISGKKSSEKFRRYNITTRYNLCLPFIHACAIVQQQVDIGDCFFLLLVLTLSLSAFVVSYSFRSTSCNQRQQRHRIKRREDRHIH